MNLNKAAKISLRKVKRKVVLSKELNLSDYDIESFKGLEEDGKSDLAAKRKGQNIGRERAKKKRGGCSVVAKTKVLKPASPKVRRYQESYNNILNDSNPFEESPFSKMAKTARNDMGLKYVPLDNFHSPSSLGVVQSKCSGCMSNLSDTSFMSIENINASLSFSELIESRGASKTPDRGSVPRAVHRWTKILGESLSLSTINSPSRNSSSERSDVYESLSPDMVEGIFELPPSLLRGWRKVSRKRNNVFTSSPINKISLPLSMGQEAESSINSEWIFIQSKDQTPSSRSSTLPTPRSPSEVDEMKSSVEENPPSPLVPSLHTTMSAIFHACEQLRDVRDFSSYVTERSPVALEKVAEGVFSEVFLFLDEKEKRSIWKIQPFGGDIIFNGVEQKKSGEIMSEILLSRSLSDLRRGEKLMTECFVESLNFKCVHGPFPKQLLECWQKYDNEKGCENDCPSIFPNTQLLLIMEMEHAGITVEDFIFASAPQALSVFTQVAYALAVAETALEFEHRDLHWGNVLVSKTSDQEISYNLNGKRITLKTRGVSAKIVDYSLSRATIDGQLYYADLSESSEIFESTGEYQFEIYRLMRKHNNNQWEKYMPYTNVLWLHYLILQMCKAVTYKNKKAKIHREYMKKMVAISSCILEFSSALNYVSLQEYYF